MKSLDGAGGATPPPADNGPVRPVDGDLAGNSRVGLICFAFGAARVGPGEELAGPVLVQMLTDLGLTASAARSALLRMRQQGLLHSSRVGREARYRLAPAVDAAQARLYSHITGDRRPWTGSFNGVLYGIPERHRAYRDRLRECAQLLGYATLRPGLAIAAGDRWEELMSLLGPAPRGSQLLRAELTFSEDDSRRMAVDLWGLDRVAERYRAAIADARARTFAAETIPPAGRDAFREFSDTALPAYAAVASDPALPVALLPDDWPGDELAAVIRNVLRVFGPLVQDYLSQMTGRRRGGAEA